MGESEGGARERDGEALRTLGWPYGKARFWRRKVESGREVGAKRFFGKYGFFCYLCGLENLGRKTFKNIVFCPKKSNVWTGLRPV